MIITWLWQGWLSSGCWLCWFASGLLVTQLYLVKDELCWKTIIWHSACWQHLYDASTVLLGVWWSMVLPHVCDTILLGHGELAVLGLHSHADLKPSVTGTSFLCLSHHSNYSYTEGESQVLLHWKDSLVLLWHQYWSGIPPNQMLRHNLIRKTKKISINCGQYSIISCLLLGAWTYSPFFSHQPTGWMSMQSGGHQ